MVLGLVGLALAVILCGIYSFAYYKFTRIMTAQIDATWAELESMPHIRIEGNKPIIGGFPKPPEIKFSGRIYLEQSFSPYLDSDLEIELPELEISGFPLPGLKLYLNTPQGLTISQPLINQSLRLDGATALLTLPRHMPRAVDYDALKEWQSRSDPIIVDAFQAKAQEIIVGSTGTLGLDPDLQLDLKLDARIMGVQEFLNRLKENPRLRRNNAGKNNLASAESFLKLISKTDDKTGQSYFDIGIFIQNQSVLMGPMRLYKLPPLIWPGSPVTVGRDPEELQKSLSRHSLRPE